MKRVTLTVCTFLLIGIFLISCDRNKPRQAEIKEGMGNPTHKEMKGTMKMGKDNRISLQLSPQKAQHQLMNMRSHVMAVQSILNLLSKDEFDKASEVAHSKLGLTPEMEKMCTSFSNPEFVELGLEFHKSADRLGEVLKTKDKNKSLQALSTTMNSCVKCHSTFRQ